MCSSDLPEEIDAERAKAAKERAEKRLEQKSENRDLDLRRAQLALMRSLTRLELKR